MAVDREEFERLDQALRTNVRLAIGRIAEACEGLDGLLPDELEAALMEVVAPIVVEHGDVAATIALEWYERQREAAGVEGEFTPTLAEPVPRSYIAADVREAVEPQRRGTSDYSGLVANLQGRTTRLVMRPADETFRINVEADPAHPRWAFVPHVGACGFCVMLGSNGWMYSSRQAVLRSRHTNCTCTPVADFDTENPHLDGYDPEWMRQAYARCYDTVIDEVNRQWAEMSPEERARYKRGKTDFERDMVVAEMNRRDREWLRTGRRPGVRYTPPELRDVILAERDHEAKTADRLDMAGFPVEMREATGEYRDRTADSMIQGTSWEFKAPKGSGYLSVYNQLKSALYGNDKHLINPQSDRIVISGVRTSMSLEDMERGLRVALDPERGLTPEERARITQVLLVDEEGNTRRRFVQ